MFGSHYCYDCANLQFDEELRFYICRLFRVTRIPDKDRLCGGNYLEPKAKA